MASAWHTGLRYWHRILLLALLVFGSLTCLELLVEVFVHSSDSWVKPLLDIVVSALDVLGVVFYAGMLDSLVGAAQHGRTEHTTREILWSLPYRKLVIADLMFAVLVALGFLFFVVPGFVVFTLLALVGPLIKIEGGTVLGSTRRSIHLVRKRVWLVAVLVTLPVILGTAAVSVVIDVVGLSRYFALVLSAVTDDALLIVTAILAVEITFRLITASAPASGSRPVSALGTRSESGSASGAGSAPASVRRAD